MSSTHSPSTSSDTPATRNRPRRYHSTTTYADRLSPGTVVVDSEQPPEAQDEAIVVAAPFASINEWNVIPWKDRTVADDNPSYNPDEWVTIVVYRSELERVFPYYSGQQPFSLTTLNNHDVKFYAFPDSRLTRKRMQRAHEIPLDDIRPCRYHTRSFNVEGNESFIEETRNRGFPIPYPTVRVFDTGSETPDFELLDGHKRTWIAHVAGLDTIKCQCIYVDEREAARRYAENHFEKLSTDERTYVESQINDDIDITVQTLLDN